LQLQGDAGVGGELDQPGFDQAHHFLVEVERRVRVWSRRPVWLLRTPEL
jgi:hypothetical protein